MGKIKKKQNCRLCGQEFIPEHSSQHYCDGCRERVLDAYKAYLEAGEPMQKYCMICGSKIENKLFRSKTVCSRGCSCTLYSLTKSWRVANGRSKLKQTAPAPAARKRRKKKPLSHLGDDIAEARRRGISYGLWMSRKAGRL